MFFNYFNDILEGPEFDLEELYAALIYEGDEHNQLLYDINISIIKLFIKSRKYHE